MTCEEFVAALDLLAFEGSGMDFHSKSGRPLFFVHVESDGAFVSYDYGEDTGPIAITDPSREPFDVVIERLIRELAI
jgi:hypothetical protein